MKIRSLFSIAAAAAVCLNLSAMPVPALEDGAYTCTVTPHYRHPVTGVIEDSGGESSEVLGQSMTEGATLTQGLIEQQEGRTYATVRLALMDNIENVDFMVQQRGDETFTEAEYDIMKEDLDLNESDFRFEIPDESCVVRATFYVIPMGRDVVYYIDFSDLKAGSGDFVTELDDGVTPENDDNESPAESGGEVYNIPETVVNDAKGLTFFDEQGNEIFPLSQGEDKAESKNTKDKARHNAAVPIATAAAITAACIAGGVIAHRRRQ